jgi:hypothetical protein
MAAFGLREKLAKLVIFLLTFLGQKYRSCTSKERSFISQFGGKM